LQSKRYYLILILSSLISLFSYCRHSQDNTIKFTHIYDPLAGPHGQLNMGWINERLDEFQKLHPGLSVELEQAKWDQIDTKCMADFRAGIPHDVILTSPQFLPKHFVVGDLLDLAPYLNWNEQQVNEFAWNPVWQACEQGGKRIGIPMGAHTRLCIYHKDMFAEAGLDPDRPPRTLEQLVEFTQKLTRDIDGDGKIDVWGLGIYFGPSRATIELAFAPIIWHYGGKLWDEHTKQAVFASLAGIKTAQFLSDLMNKYKVTPRWVVSGTYDDVVLRSFLDQKIAIAWGWGSYWIQPLEEKGWIQGCFPPTPEGEMTKIGAFLTPTNIQAQFTNAWTISLHALTQKPVESVQLIETFVEPETLFTFPDAGLPARLSTWGRPEYQTNFYQIWFEAARKGRSMPPTAHYEELANTVAAALQEILIKNAPIEETLMKFQQAYNVRYAGE
jgi:ABC-type glycerol-3-phosphate transport system substrate-binding protein